MSASEIVFIVALAGGFLIPPAVFGQWWLFGVFALFFACFGIVEFCAVKFTGKSVSQKVWALRKKNPKGFWIVISGMALGWIALLWHFIAP